MGGGEGGGRRGRGGEREGDRERGVQQVRTVDIEDVVVVGLSHRVGRHTAIGAVVGLVEVFNEQVCSRDDGVGGHVILHLDPVHLLGSGGEDGRTGGSHVEPNALCHVLSLCASEMMLRDGNQTLAYLYVYLCVCEYLCVCVRASFHCR